MTDHQCCPQCGALISTEEIYCPFCRKALSPSVPKTPPPSATIDPDQIRRKRGIILCLILISLVSAAIFIPIGITAHRIAKEEIPDATPRDVRFNRIEVQSPTYQTLQIILQTSKVCGSFFQLYCVVIWGQYLRAMGYSRWGVVGNFLVMLIPLVNLIVFFVLLDKGRALIAEHS